MVRLRQGRVIAEETVGSPFLLNGFKERQEIFNDFLPVFHCAVDVKHEQFFVQYFLLLQAHFLVLWQPSLNCYRVGGMAMFLVYIVLGLLLVIFFNKEFLFIRLVFLSRH